MSGLRRIFELARARPARVVFPEASDPRILRAVARLAAEQIVRPVLVGEPKVIHDAASEAGVELPGVDIEDPTSSSLRGVYLTTALNAMRGKAPAASEIAELLRDPLYFGAAMVRAGSADGCVAGAARSSAETVRAALRIVGPAPGVKLVSSFFLIELREPTAAGEDVLAFADCGLVPYPDAAGLAEIAWWTALNFRMLVGRQPKLAFLSFSTHGSASHESVDRVRQARDLLLERGPDFPVDGELQLDAALVPEVARSKAPRSSVAGAANVLIFPNLDAGNIAYKTAERIGGAQAVGPILQGLARPANDLSRGCTEDDIVVAAAITAVQYGATL